jgi:hypothetical protein
MTGVDGLFIGAPFHLKLRLLHHDGRCSISCYIWHGCGFGVHSTENLSLIVSKEKTEALENMVTLDLDG